MNRRFVPKPYREAYRKNEEKKREVMYHNDPSYKIYWWFKTKPWEKTGQFFIAFKVPMNRDAVHVEFSKCFPCKVDVFANEFWYVVELGEKLSWREVDKHTSEALEGLL